MPRAHPLHKARIEALGNHGLRALPSEANFVMVLFEGAVAAADALKAIGAAGYAVRHLPGQGLPHALRITIGTAEQMDAIADTIARAGKRRVTHPFGRHYRTGPAGRFHRSGHSGKNCLA